MVCFCAILPPYTLNWDYFHQPHSALVFWNIFLFWLIRMFYQLSFQICIKLPENVLILVAMATPNPPQHIFQRDYLASSTRSYTEYVW